MKFSGPFTRLPRTSDAILAAALAVLAALVRDTPSDDLLTRAITDVPVWVLAVIAVAAAALYFRRRAPLVALGVALVGWALLLIPDEYSLFLIPLVGVYSVALYEPTLRRAQFALYAAYSVLVIDGIVRD